jgi:DNA-binding transcriptional MocR family regulator
MKTLLSEQYMSSDYLALADEVAAQIRDGALKIGERLPPQRQFAWARNIAVSTASRVYGELLRRGLVVGEVGRGTFVAGETARNITAATVEPRGSRIDLELNFSILPSQAALMAKALEGLARADALQATLPQSASIGTVRVRQLAAQFLAVDGWTPRPGQLVFTGNGRQSIAAVLAALVPPGGRCGVEAITYPFIKGTASRLGITLVPLAMDEHGVRPDAVQKAHREGRLSAIYVQPVIHNPLGMTMPPQRRAELLRVVEKLDLVVVEDFIYGFLDEVPPLAAESPERCVVIDSLSKRIAPGLSLGFIVSPQHLREDIMAAVRAGGWMAQGFSFAAAERFMSDGTAREIARLKREDAKVRQEIAAEMLKGFQLQTNPKSYHVWLVLPEQWRSQAFVAAAARHDIALTPSSAFSVNPGHAPNAIRLALAQPPHDQLREALGTLAHILKGSDTDGYFTE